MKKVLNTKEKIYSIVLTIMTILLSIIINNKTFDAFIGQSGIDPNVELGFSSIVPLVIITISSLIGLLFSSLILHLFIKVLKPQKETSYGLAYLIYVFTSTIENIVIIFSIYILGANIYLQYSTVFTLILGILGAIIIAGLYYRFDIVTRNKMFIIGVVITILNIALALVTTLVS